MATSLTPPPALALLALLVLPVLPGWGASTATPPGGGEALEALGALLSSGTGSLPRGAVESLVGTAAARAHCGAGPCGKCISAADVFGLLGKAGAGARLEAAELPWLGAAVLLTLLDPDAACAAATAGTWAARARALHDAFANGTRGTHGTDGTDGTGDGTDGTGGPDLQEVAALLEAVRPHYRSAGTRQPCLDAAAVVAESAAVPGVPGVGAGARVLVVLGTQLLRGRCLRAAPPLPGPEFFLDFILNRFGNGSQSLTLEGLMALMEELGLGPHDHDHDHEHGARSARGAANETQQWDGVCFSAQQLLQAHGLGAAGVSRQELQELSPALLQQVLSGACGAEHGETPSGGGLSVAERYLYGSLATLVICLGSLVGAAVLLCSRCPRAHRYALQLLLALAVGTLTGDALLHLLPQFLQLHSHTDGAHAHAGGAEVTWQLVAVLGGLYGFFLLESLLGLLAPGGHEEGSHSDPPGGLQLCAGEQRRKQLEGTSCSELVEEPPLSQSEQELRKQDLRALPCMVTLGDALHNLADGLALGAAFGTSWRTGLGTALAVLCHELPHELGDFAALLHAGLSVRRALLLNVLSALPAFLGLYLALGLATGAAFQGWIFTVATGFFLYVALCDMLPAMLRVRDPRPWLLFALHNAGLLGGWGLLLLLALYEDSIAL